MRDEIIEGKKDYLARLQKMLSDCLDDKNTHAVLVIGNDASHVMGMFAVNANPMEVGVLITAAAGYVLEDATTQRTLN